MFEMANENVARLLRGLTIAVGKRKRGSREDEGCIAQRK